MALGLPEDPGQQRRLLIGALPLLALFAYWYFLHPGYVQELEAMETRVEALEARNAQARLRAPQSRELEERLAMFERHIDRLEELVPRNEEVSQLLNAISQRADQIGVTVAQFTPGQAAPGTHYSRRTFEMTVHGEYHEIGRFLSEIGSLSRIITPSELNLIPITRRGTQLLQASFLLETYVLPEPGAAEAGGAGA